MKQEIGFHMKYCYTILMQCHVVNSLFTFTMTSKLGCDEFIYMYNECNIMHNKLLIINQLLACTCIIIAH